MINEKLLTTGFRRIQDSYLPCPTCSNGYLVIDDSTFNQQETSISQKAHDHDAWEPEWISYVYSCIFKCTNQRCNEKVSSSGYGYVDFDIEVDEFGHQFQDWYDCFQPSYFQPPLKIIQIPEKVPEGITNKLYESFELFFCSPPSAANHARSSIELILNHLKVPKTTNKTDNKGKEKDLTLHSRIQKLSSEHQEIKDLLLAIKWIGNEGSHAETKLEKKHLIELYEILEYVLIKLFDDKTERVKAIAKRINEAKGIK